MVQCLTLKVCLIHIYIQQFLSFWNIKDFSLRRPGSIWARSAAHIRRWSWKECGKPNCFSTCCRQDVGGDNMTIKLNFFSKCVYFYFSLIQHVGFETDCRRLKAGVERVLKAGKVRFYFSQELDWFPNLDTQIRTRDLGGYATTREFTQAVISAIR